MLARAIVTRVGDFARVWTRICAIARVSGHGLNQEKERLGGLPDEIIKVWVNEEMTKK